MGRGPDRMPRHRHPRRRRGRIGQSGGALGESAPGGPVNACIGSVKSNIGHTLTAAGSAGLLKVLLAMQGKDAAGHGEFHRGPQSPPAYESSPFRVLSTSRPWQKRAMDTPRRAAISAFGFGGINAHVLLEEVARSPPRQEQPVVHRQSQFTEPASAAAHRHRRHGCSFRPLGQPGRISGTCPGRRRSACEPSAPRRWWGVEQAAWFQREGRDVRSLRGFYLDEIAVAADRFRIPPRELEEMLPQQLLMLKVAAGAIADARFNADAPAAHRRLHRHRARSQHHQFSPALVAFERGPDLERAARAGICPNRNWPTGPRHCATAFTRR